ncbi:hypothetical protein [Halosegnis sp.]|uniref:hypothetical protein n=1 Tax=Halosegnis sp. TaxID=2864959 RepID=UPI0035D4BE03
MEPPAFRRDKRGHAVTDYPERTDDGRLLGVVASGNAAYADDESVTLAILGNDGTLVVPPRERGLATELPLAAVGLSPGEYIRYVADEAGPWRALAPAGETAIEGVEPPELLTDGPVEVDLDAVLETLADGGSPGTGEGDESLRRAAMDHPGQMVARVDTLFDLLEARAGATAAPDPEWREVAVAADIAFALARAARADPAAVATRLDRLVDLLGRERASADRPPTAHLTDVLDVLGRRETSGVAGALADAIEADDQTAEAALNALYRLEHRYSTGDHPLCESETVRTAVTAAAARSGRVGEAAADVETIHQFHRGTTG